MKNDLVRIDKSLMLLVPALVFLLLIFVYPFIYGFLLSFNVVSYNPGAPRGGLLDNYKRFFTEPRLYGTIWTTLKLSLPITIVNVCLSLPIAFSLRKKSKYQKLVTTILVIPICLGAVLLAEGMLTYFGPKGWFVQALSALGIHVPQLTHNPTGVIISLVISGFPFVFLLVLSYITGIDPVLPRAASTLGATPLQQFRHIYLPLLTPGIAMAFCLAFVQAFSVYPSAQMLGNPAGPTRVITIAAYEEAFEYYRYSMGSAVAIIMGAVQLVVVAIVLGARKLFYRGPVSSGGKG
jgi:putative spermidine/putrescine transport system permease protein